MKSILDMAHTLGMQVVAEGVEQNEQITRLISMGCEFGQGFFFSKPLCAQEAEGLMSAMMSPVPTFPLWRDVDLPCAGENASGT